MQQGDKSTLFLFGKVWNLSGLAFALPARWRCAGNFSKPEVFPDAMLMVSTPKHELFFGKCPAGISSDFCQRFKNFRPIFLGRQKRRSAMFAEFTVNGAELFAVGTSLAHRPFLHA
jgi:hypothetical protein